MGNSIFGIGSSGLNVAQAGLITTGHNITNASTPGFSRQEIVQSSNMPQFTGGGFFGQGAQVSTVKRLYSDFLSNQVNLAQTQGSQLDSYYAEIKQIDNMLGDVSAGLAPALQDFFSGVNGVAANPASMPSRQAMLSGAQELASRFQTMDQRLTEISSGINGALQSSVGAINSFARQIAALNANISLAEAATNMQPANDLRDQRDMLIADLGKEIRVTKVTQSDGSYNVFVGNGQPVVVGKQAFDLVAAPSMEDAQRLEVGYTSGGTTVLLSASTLQGGNLGGLLAFRSETLDATQNALGRVAIGVAQSFNTQHLLGQDLNGTLGTQFFNVASAVVLPRVGNALAPPATVSATLDASALTTSDYRLFYDGANFVLSRLSDGQAVTTAQTAAGAGSMVMDGITLAISGATTNDSWLIEPTRTGARDFSVALSDPTKIAAASPVRTGAALANSGSASISAASVSSVASLPLAVPVQLTFSAATGKFTVSGAVAGPFAYPTAVPGSATAATGAPIVFTGNPIAANAFAINGVSVGAIAAGTDAVTQGANVANAINLSAVPGVTATYSATTGAVTLTGAGGRQIVIAGTVTDTGLTAGVTPGNTVVPAFTGVSPAVGGIAANALVINGVSVGAVTAGANAVIQGANVAAAINLVSASSGVTATSSATTGALTLSASGGRQIAISGTLTNTGLTAAVIPGGTITFNGITFKVSGAPADGDVFMVERNSSGVSDSSNAVTLAGLQTVNLLGKDASILGGQAVLNFQQAYAQLVSEVGNKTRQTQVMATAQQNLVAQTKQAQQSIAGVNLDDEAANLLRYQQAYQASGKMMQIATSLFQTLLDLGK